MDKYRIPKYPILAEGEYVMDYREPVFKTIGEHEIIMPREPSIRYFQNGTKKTKDQRFLYTNIPTGLKKSLDEEKIVRREWHRRLHGVWYMINGQPVYIPGKGYHFFNYWLTEQNQRPDFRMEAVEYYWIWDDVYMDQNCLGLLDIKCRRLGDTEKALHVAYEEMTRLRNTRVGMQHMKRDDAKKNYLRLLNGHRKMAYFFRPVSRGTTSPQSALELLYPTQSITEKRMRDGHDLYEDEGTIPSVGSRADYEATELRAYDGSRKEIYIGDEYGKISPKIMNTYEQWGIIRRCLTLYNDQVIIGKAILPTTVEDVDSGETVKMMQKFWDYSDPGKLHNGRTISGLRRIFRGFQYAAPVDEYGFHKVKEADEWRDAELKRLLDMGDMAGVIELQRKQPKDIHEALQVAAADCTLNPHLLDVQIMALKKKEVIIRRGNLVWENDFGGNVEFVDNIHGRWIISQMPVVKNKRQTTDDGYGPGNKGIYSIGGDPIDSRSKAGSQGALAVFRKLWLPDEPANVHIDENGDVINTEDMITDQFVCVYMHRPDDPYDYFVDSLKTAIFYGAQIFFELQKPYVVNKFHDTGFRAYLARRPKETITNARDKNKAQHDEGASATGIIISLYVDALKSHISKRYKTYRILEQLQDFRRFNTDNRTERDITVASGFALLGSMDKRMRRDIDEMKNQWTQLPWATYKNPQIHLQ